jgi:hypothetical protein
MEPTTPANRSLSRRATALVALVALSGQILAVTSVAVRADGHNPFARVPAPAFGPHGTQAPTKPAEAPAEAPAQAPSQAPDEQDEALTPPCTGPFCLAPEKPVLACPAPRAHVPADFARLVRQYIDAYAANDIRYIHLVRPIAISVFEVPGSPEYIDKLKYLDSFSTAAPEAIFNLAKVLQQRWEAAYGMELSMKLDAGIDDPNISQTLVEKRNERRWRGRRIGGIVGGVVALAALGLTAVRNPLATSRYFAVFRALLPEAGMTAGIFVGAKVADRVSDTYEREFLRDLPLAPAQVMHLGLETNLVIDDEDTLVQTFVPLLTGVAAGDATLALMAGSGLASRVTGVIRTIRAVNKSAAPGKIDPPVLIASLIVSLVVEHLAGHVVNWLEYRSLKAKVTESREAIEQAIARGDDAKAFSAADALVANSLVLAAYHNRPILAANAEFLRKLAEASNKFCWTHPEYDPYDGTGAGSYAPPPPAPQPEPVADCEKLPAYKAEVDRLVTELSRDVRQALKDLDQKSDADFEAYLALDVIESRDPKLVSQLSDVAKLELKANLDLFAARPDRTDAPSSPEYRRRFGEYVQGLLAARDRKLARELKDKHYVRHGGHTLLQASAFLRSTGVDYIRQQADFLMSEIAHEQLMLHFASRTLPGTRQVKP